MTGRSTVKALYCMTCETLFRLTRKEMRMCKCGKVRGRYLKDGRHAEVSQNADTISIAIENRSFKTAIKRMRRREKHRPESTREDYKIRSSIVAWVRPNSGPGNPHSSKLKSNLKPKADVRNVPLRKDLHKGKQVTRGSTYTT